jgi:hypothetical protein
MTRILADLPDEDIKWLNETAIALGRSRSSLISEAVKFFRGNPYADKNLDWLEAGFGLWKDRTDIGDAVEWQRRERASWTRPWDDDYEEVKAEFPDLFDEYDDRQRQIYLDMAKGKFPEVIVNEASEK